MQTVIPDKSWDCFMPEGIPGPATGELVFDAEMQVGDVHDIGETQFGKRVQIDVKGGTIKGPKFNGTLMDRGLDYQLTLSNGAVEVEQINIVSVSGGGSVLMKTCGTAPSADGDVRVVMDFEAANSGSLSFLNTGKFVGTRKWDAAKKTLSLHVVQVTAAADTTNAVTVTNPADVPNQTWACKVDSGTKGAEIYRESVGIGGGSVSVGASKRGTRNIIPITGGTTTGMVVGGVLSGGADYQILANGTFKELDARYSLKTNDGEVIIVRNCGPIGALIPVFEASKSGKYAYLNENNWLSSDPGIGLGVVNLTIYRKR